MALIGGGTGHRVCAGAHTGLTGIGLGTTVTIDTAGIVGLGRICRTGVARAGTIVGDVAFSRIGAAYRRRRLELAGRRIAASSPHPAGILTFFGPFDRTVATDGCRG